MQLSSKIKENKELNEKEFADENVVLESKPTKLMLVPTSRCNIKCIMCDRVMHENEIPYKDLRKVYAIFEYVENIDLQGGEPFLLNYFESFFKDLLQFKHLKVSILTNGLLIDERWADLLLDGNVSLSFSIDSVVKSTYEYIRRGARYADVIRNIELINKKSLSKKRLSPLNKINVVLMRANYKELILFPKFCKDFGFSELTIDYLRPDIIPEEDILTTNYNSAAVSYLKKIVPEIAEECGENGVRFDSAAIAPFLNTERGNDKNNTVSSKDAGSKTQKCRIPWKKLFIDSDGTIRPDCLCSVVIGKLSEIESIEEVWNNKFMQKYRANIVKNETSGWCSKGCLINAVPSKYKETG